MGRSPINIDVPKKDQQELRSLLKGGVQPVRLTLRALALLQLAEDISAPQIAKTIPLTRQAIRRLGTAIRKLDWRALSMRSSAPAPPRCWTTIRNSGLSRWCARTRPRAAFAGQSGWWSKKPSNENWCHE